MHVLAGEPSELAILTVAGPVTIAGVLLLLVSLYSLFAPAAAGVPAVTHVPAVFEVPASDDGVPVVVSSLVILTSLHTAARCETQTLL
jgi:hypothetical protein